MQCLQKLLPNSNKLSNKLNIPNHTPKLPKLPSTNTQIQKGHVKKLFTFHCPQKSKSQNTIFFLAPSRSMPLKIFLTDHYEFMNHKKKTIERIFSASRLKAKGTVPQTLPRPDLTYTGES